MHPIIRLVLAACVVVVAACDRSTSPTVAAVGGDLNTTGLTTITITPGTATMTVGSTLQLATNEPTALQSQVQWTSSDSRVAVTSPSGFISALATGSTTISARLSSDTTHVAVATINVISP
jgi:uncharacterized protein YjdB